MDTGLILEEMIPPDTGILFQYINYLTQRERIDEAGQVGHRNNASSKLGLTPCCR